MRKAEGGNGGWRPPQRKGALCGVLAFELKLKLIQHQTTQKTVLRCEGEGEGEAPVSLDEEVLFFGKNDAGCLRVEEVAAAANTISYELLVRVGRRVPRVIVDKTSK